MATARESIRLLQAIGRVLKDSTKTSEIHVAEEITGRGRFRSLLEEMRGTEEGRALLAARPELSSDEVDYDALRALAPSTLGGAYVRHLDAYGLSADSQATATRFVDDEEIAYLMRRFRQTHDVWHALTALGAEPYNEVVIHAFSLGQLHLPVSWMIVSLGGIKHGVLEGRFRVLGSVMPHAYAVGRRARPLMPVWWEKMWGDPLAEVQARLGVEPLS
jgi:ubiquinone biosynthesis protein COQ4